MMNEPDEFISKGRLDAITDGVFAFAMTPLVVNLDLPQDFNPTTSDELLAALTRLGDTFIAYIVTFLVLALFWLGRARTKEEPETASVLTRTATREQEPLSEKDNSHVNGKATANSPRRSNGTPKSG